MRLQLSQDNITIGEQELQQVMMCLTNCESSDCQFKRKGELKEELELGCYHNLQKPAAD